MVDIEVPFTVALTSITDPAVTVPVKFPLVALIEPENEALPVELIDTELTHTPSEERL